MTYVLDPCWPSSGIRSTPSSIAGDLLVRMKHAPSKRVVRDGFRRRLLEVLESKALKQTELARRLGVSPQWVNQLVQGVRKPRADTVQRIADALQVPIEVLAPLPSELPATPIVRLRERLGRLRTELGASSCTLYVRDPIWRSEYRVAAMSGVKYEEPMFGFLSKHRETMFGAERFVATRVDKGVAPAQLEQVPHAVRQLFGSFREREAVRAYARVAHPPHVENPDVILFVNYPGHKEFTEAAKSEHRKQLDSLLPELPAVHRQIAEHDKDWLAEGARIVQPALSITAKDVIGRDLRTYFGRILESALDALGIPIDIGVGTIHLYNRDANTLVVAGSCGRISSPAQVESQSLALGAGVAAWVVERRRALLIRDLSTSEFAAIHVAQRDSVRSELAVPLEVDGELLGVLGLQCTEPNRFKPHHVRSVWYAANRVAIVYRLHSQAEMNRELLEICSRAAIGGKEAHVALHQVAQLAREYLRAYACNIWIYDSQTKRFTQGASSQGHLFDLTTRDPAPPLGRDVSPTVRVDGFSAQLLRWQCPLWLSEIRDETIFKRHYWFSARWQEGLPDGNDRATVNTQLQGRDVRCQLGLPITVQGTGVGVAWVKFAREQDLPTDTLVTLAQGFMAAAGLVLAAMHGQQAAG
jgi:transcriptional regulator with XRE-family HTH domain/putative methionine-R-sulfoxide reductase with GAF domain